MLRAEQLFPPSVVLRGRFYAGANLIMIEWTILALLGVIIALQAWTAHLLLKREHAAGTDSFGNFYAKVLRAYHRKDV